MTTSRACLMQVSTIGAVSRLSPKTSSIPKPPGRKSPACNPKPNPAASSFTNASPSIRSLSAAMNFSIRASAPKPNSSPSKEATPCPVVLHYWGPEKRRQAAALPKGWAKPGACNTYHETIPKNNRLGRRRWRLKTPSRSLRCDGPAPVNHHRQHRRRHRSPRPENLARPGHSHVHIGGSSRPQKRLGPSLRNFSRPETLSRLWPAQL